MSRYHIEIGIKIHHYLDCGLWKPCKRNKYLFLKVKTSKTHHQICSKNSYQYCSTQGGNTKACKKYSVFRHNEILGEKLNHMVTDSELLKQKSKNIHKIKKTKMARHNLSKHQY